MTTFRKQSGICAHTHQQLSNAARSRRLQWFHDRYQDEGSEIIEVIAHETCRQPVSAYSGSYAGMATKPKIRLAAAGGYESINARDLKLR
jgi:hypothetical protein